MSQVAATHFDEKVPTITGINNAVRTARELLGLLGPKAIAASDLGVIPDEWVQSLIAVYKYPPSRYKNLAVGEFPDLDVAARKAIEGTMTEDILTLTALFVRKVGYDLRRASDEASNRIYYPQLYSCSPNEAEKQEARINTLGQCVSFMQSLGDKVASLDDHARTAALEGLVYIFEALRNNRSDYACAQQTIKQGMSLAKAFAIHGEALAEQLIVPLGADAQRLGDSLIHPLHIPPLFSALSNFRAPHWCPGSLCHETPTNSESNG